MPSLGWARHAALASLWFGFNFHWLPIGFVLIQSQLRDLPDVPHDQFGTSLGLMVGAGAMEALASLAGTGDDADLKELAVLLRAMQGFDAAKPEDVAAQLQALSARDKPWRGLALELMAAAAIKANDLARARQLLAELRDDEAAPAGARARATELLSSLGEAAPAK